jgi:hypothetical protein
MIDDEAEHLLKRDLLRTTLPQMTLMHSPTLSRTAHTTRGESQRVVQLIPLSSLCPLSSTVPLLLAAATGRSVVDSEKPLVFFRM